MSGAPYIISTKLHIPETVDKLVTRPRLFQLLDDGADRRLTLVCAPAGSGKTTLLAEWAKRQRTDLAWVSLDEYDNDFRRFWGHAVAAIDRVRSHFSHRLEPALADSQPANFQTLMVQLINELHASDAPLVLILDDYHLIGNADIHRAFVYFLERLPAGVRCVVSARHEPPLSLPRLESHGQLLRVPAEQLNFTFGEGRDFCLLMGGRLPESAMRLLHERTEGWVTGMKLAMLSRKEDRDYGRLLDLIADNRIKLSDYLFEEVYRQLPQDNRQFLLQTAVLKKLCGPLCEAVAGITGGKLMLERLEKANLFLVSLDRRGIWYRYHHLFSEFLLHELEKEEPQRIPELHRLAADWFRDNDYPEDAVEHYLAGGHAEAALDLIESLLSTMINKRWETLLRWMTAIPRDALERRPVLYLSFVFFKLAAQEPDVDGLIERGEQLFPENGASGTALLASLYLIKALHAADYLRDIELTIRYMNECVRLAPEGLPLQEIEINVGEMSILNAFCHMSADLAQIERFFRAMIELWQRDDPYVFTGFFFVGFGELLYVRGELEEAEKQVRKGIAIAKRKRSGKLLAPAASALSVILNATGRAAESLRVLHEAKSLLQKWGFLYWCDQLYLREIRFAAAEADAGAADRRAGQHDKIEAWAEEYALTSNWKEDEDRHPSELFADLTFVRVLMALNRHDEAKEALERLEGWAFRQRRWGEHQEILLLKALCCMRQDRVGEAMAALDEVLPVAERNGAVRLFIDEGGRMIELLKCRLDAGGGNMPFVRRMFEACRNGSAAQEENGGINAILTSKERQVLELMITGMPNRLIAEQLNITRGTLKTHINHIYQKLMVSDRWSAVSRARELMHRDV